MVRKPLLEPAADEPADRKVRLRLAHQEADVHDARQEPRQHRTDRGPGVDPGPTAVGATAVGDLVVEPAEIQNPADARQDAVGRNRLLKLPGNEQLQLGRRLALGMSWLSPFPQQHHVA